MVAVRAKVGGRSFQRMAAMPKGKKVFEIDCAVPAADGIFDDETCQGFEQYLQENTKMHGRKGKLADKCKINFHNNVLTVATTMKYRKKYFKYLTKKFLKKKGMRDYLRILADGKKKYVLKYFNIKDTEEEAAEE